MDEVAFVSVKKASCRQRKGAAPLVGDEAATPWGKKRDYAGARIESTGDSIDKKDQEI
jgi:hypothetical protein